MHATYTVVILAGLGLCAAGQNQLLTPFVNLFIGTETGANGGSGGNAFPGAAIPHAMAKVGIDVDITPRQAGYISLDGSITGISLLHDEGTGGNTAGGYGNFPLSPVTNCNFTLCPVAIDDRKSARVPGTDAAQPGYFTSSLNNGAKIEATSTRRAGLIRFTYQNWTNNLNHVVVDLTNDLQRSFQGGSLQFDPSSKRVKLGGTYLQSYGPSNYTVFGCYDFQQPLTAFGTWNGTTIKPNATSLNFPYPTTGVQAGLILSFTVDNNRSILARFGVSFLSSDQACSNAESEIPTWDWNAVQSSSASKWEDVLNRIQIDTAKENSTIVELLYSSLYRSALVPANLTGENPYWDNTHPFFDALFCSWDTFRTVHPLLSLLSPVEWGGIVSAYVDGWRHTGYIPECRSNTKDGYVQGGSDGMPILGDFAVKYGKNAAQLGVDPADLWQALVDTAENTPPNWYTRLSILTVGRQNTAWKLFGYIPTDYNDPLSTGLETREASRSLEYALGDFAVRQAGIALGKSSETAAIYANRSMNFVNLFDPNVTSDGFTGFMQRKFPNGTFAFSDPVDCSPLDTVGHSCARGTDNNVGFYESSSWEYSFFAPQSMATIIELMGGNDTFINRVNHYFDAGYFLAGNEPGFEMPWAYHYANRPDLSARRVRDVVFTNFNTGIGGLPGNDDSGAMASLLVFHILGLYPVPSSTQLLIGSPLLSSYTLSNDFFRTHTRVTVNGFDPTGVVAQPANSSRVYVQSVMINGVEAASRCWIDFNDLVGASNEIEIQVTNVLGDALGCGDGPNALPDSLATGGFKF
ncbi:glycoside hydrolase family 92 protein [Sphaerobolus stellatus SS14]|uniref:Glycoside hydrolase family 92 protein n=1 Tax=Sphaerobolus stellatus (strain SS14) TaxID=990650 RepID=A0A0C9VDL9_SPHS4|nr:glycoside hydrolase family 92 protein [Sphaerobolus stellatus SS14]